MNVKELKEKIENLPDNVEVCFNLSRQTSSGVDKFLHLEDVLHGILVQDDNPQYIYCKEGAAEKFELAESSPALIFVLNRYK